MNRLTSPVFVDYIGIPVAVLVCLALLIVVAQADAPVLRQHWLQLCRWWYDGGTRCPRCGEKEPLEQLAKVRVCWCCRMVELGHHDAAAWALSFRGASFQLLTDQQGTGV